MTVSVVTAGSEMDTRIDRVEKRILDAAEIEFAENGFDGTSLRSIVAQADVANGSIHYYFKTKEELFRRVVERRAKHITADRLRSLDACRAGEGRPPMLEQIIHAYIAPLVNPALGSADVRLRFARLRARVIMEQGSSRDSGLGDIADQTDQRFLDTIAGDQSHLPREEIQLRFLIMWSALNTLCVGNMRMALGGGGGDAANSEEHPLAAFERLIPRLIAQFSRLFREPHPIESDWDYQFETGNAATTAGELEN